MALALALVLVGSALAAPATLTMRRPAPGAAGAAGSPGAAPGGAAPGTTSGASPSAAPASSAAHGGAIGDMDCSTCHTPAGWGLGAGAGASGFDHDRTGFPLRGAHVQRTCASCPTGAAKPLPRCESCHRDPHQGRNDGGCAECHTTTAWADTGALERHRRTRMPLTGAHATLDCVACHRRQGERTWSDVPRDCIGCHQKDYHRADVHPVHDGRAGGAPLPRDCGQCHRTTAWSPAVIVSGALPRIGARPADHDAWFVL
ncbi:MAG: cytochrome c3 family protein, partial [Kofleriaceae bacterium]